MWKSIFGIGARSPFTPLERRLLDELRRSLSPDAGKLLAAQLERLTSARRYSGSREVLYYPEVRGRVYHDPSVRFPDDREELKLARVRFRVPAQPGAWTADFIVVGGHFFSIVFTPAAQSIQRSDDIEIMRVDIRHDPMEAPPPAPSRDAADPTRFSGWLRDWVQAFRVTHAITPLPPVRREEAINAVSAKLPDDYLQLTEQYDGLAVEDCAILGLAEIHEVALPTASFYFLADCHGAGALGVRADSNDGAVYYLPYDGTAPLDAGTSFRRAVEERCVSGTRDLD